MSKHRVRGKGHMPEYWEWTCDYCGKRANTNSQATRRPGWVPHGQNHRHRTRLLLVGARSPVQGRTRRAAHNNTNRRGTHRRRNFAGYFVCPIRRKPGGDRRFSASPDGTRRFRDMYPASTMEG